MLPSNASNMSDDDGNDGGSQSPIASFLGMDRSSFLVADRSMFLQNYSTAPATLPDLWSEGGDPLMGVSSTSSSSSSSSMQPSQFAYSSNTSLAASLSFPSGSGQVVSPLQQQQQQSSPSASQMIRTVGVANPLATSVVAAQTQQQSLSRTLQQLQQQQQKQQQPQQMQTAPLPRMMMDQQQQQMMLLHQQQQLQQQLQQQQQVPFLNFPQQPGRAAQSTSSLELQASSLAAAAATAAVASSTSRSTARGRGGGGGGGKGDPLGSSSSLSSALTSAALGGRSVTGSASATTAAATAAAIERRSGGKHAVEEHEESEDAEDDDLDDDLDDAGGSSKKKPRSSSSGGDKVAQSRERNKIHARKSRLRKKFLLDNLKANLGGVEEENENLRMMVVKLTGKTYEELMADSAAGLPMVAIAPPISTAGMAAAAAASAAAAQAAQSQGVVVSSPRIAPISSGLAIGGLGGGGGGGIGAGFAVQLQPVASSSSNPFAQALTQPVASSSLSSSAAAVAAASSSLIPASHPALQSVPNSVINSNDFELVKALALAQHNFVISDPSLPDNPIVFASAGFYALTGYSPDEVIGRNCRFLQGAATDPRAIAAIRRGVVDGKDTAVCLINYKKDGTSFWNRFFIAALKSVDGKIVNYVGVQCQVSDALARVLVDMQSRRKNDADGTPLTAEAEVADVSVLSSSAAASSSSSSTATI